MAKPKITGYSLYIFSLRRAVGGILIFSRILTIDRCYFFFLLSVSLCYDLDLIAPLALLKLYFGSYVPPSAREGFSTQYP